MRQNALVPTWLGQVLNRMPGSSTSRSWLAEQSIPFFAGVVLMKCLSFVALLTIYPNNQRKYHGWLRHLLARVDWSIWSARNSKVNG